MDGIVSVLKPPGVSSNKVVVDIRHLFGIKRVGHLGTLDPGAAGVLPVCIGRAVRLFDYLVDKQKEYIAEISFGRSTDTQDAYGTVMQRSDSVVASEQLKACLHKFTGTIEQTVPMYSAAKYKGKALYDFARAGIQVPEKRRTCLIDSLEVIEQICTNRYLLRVRCSQGTYIRTLCHDIGATLGVPAYMSFLLRCSSGIFTLERSFSYDQLCACKKEGDLQNTLISCEDALAFLPAVVLPDWRFKPALNGLETDIGDIPDGFARLYAQDAFLGIANISHRTARLCVNLYSEKA